MPIQALPPEILSLIFRYLGSQEEHQKHKVPVLLVCRQWQQLAQPILFEDVTLSANNFLNLPEKHQNELAARVRDLAINGNSKNKWPNTLEGWLELDERLKAILCGSHRLKAFALRSSAVHNRDRSYTSFGYELAWSPVGLLNKLRASSVEDLVIDTRGSDFTVGTHICPSIARIIPRLRRLRIRMRTMCVEILDFPKGDAAIESIFINLSLGTADHLSWTFTSDCNKTRCTNLFDEMVAKGADTAKRTPSLKTMRVLEHNYIPMSYSVTDCISRTRMNLNEEIRREWIADGSELGQVT